MLSENVEVYCFSRYTSSVLHLDWCWCLTNQNHPWKLFNQSEIARLNIQALRMIDYHKLLKVCVIGENKNDIICVIIWSLSSLTGARTPTVAGGGWARENIIVVYWYLSYLSNYMWSVLNKNDIICVINWSLFIINRSPHPNCRGWRVGAGKDYCRVILLYPRLCRKCRRWGIDQLIDFTYDYIHGYNNNL